MWDSVVEDQLLRHARSNTKRKSNIETRAIAAITKFSRNSTINSFMKGCKANFMAKIKDYKENKRKYLITISNKNGSYPANHNPSDEESKFYNQIPVLFIIPTLSDLLQLINDSKNISSYK